MNKTSDIFNLNYANWYSGNRNMFLSKIKNTEGFDLNNNSFIFLFEVDKHNGKAEELLIQYTIRKLRQEVDKLNIMQEMGEDYTVLYINKYAFYFYFMTENEVRNADWKEKHQTQALESVHYLKISGYHGSIH